MTGARFEVIRKKLFYFLEEIKTLRDGGVSYFIGFGILVILFFPALILELVILLMSGIEIKSLFREYILDTSKIEGSAIQEMVELLKKQNYDNRFTIHFA